MQIQLNLEQERVVEQAMRAGLIHSPDELAEFVIAAIRSRLNLRDAPPDAEQIEDWFTELTAWSDSHSTSTPLPSDLEADR